MSTDTIIEKIKGLLRLAQSKDVHEAAAAVKAAENLISKFRIDEADLNINQDKKSEPVEDINILYETARIVSWKSTLAIILADHYGCAIFNDGIYDSSKSKLGKINRYRLVGHQSDLDLTRFMFGWITAEIERLTKRNCKGLGHITSASYAQGAVVGVNDQLQIAKQQAKVAANTSNQVTALATLDNRLAESKELLKRLHTLSKHKQYSKRHIDVDAYDQGRDAGKNMYLAKGLTSGDSKLLE